MPVNRGPTMGRVAAVCAIAALLIRVRVRTAVFLNILVTPPEIAESGNEQFLLNCLQAND
jgi:hypothetical protein